MEIILVMQSILAINAIWHNIFDTAFDNAKFKSSKKNFLFSIDNFMKILLEINFLEQRLGEAMRKVSGIVLISVHIYNFKKIVETPQQGVKFTQS